MGSRWSKRPENCRALVTKLIFLSRALGGQQPLLEATFCIGPLRRKNGIAPGIARGEVRAHLVRAKNSFEFASDAFDGSLRSLVARVSMQADPQHLPHFEGMRKHQQFGFSIRRGSDGRVREKCVANLADVGILVRVARVTRGPVEALNVKEARGTND